MTEVKPLSDEECGYLAVDIQAPGWMFGRDIPLRLLATITALKSENEKLREALEFYADRSSWMVLGPKPIDAFKAPIVLDGGQRARAALAKG